MYILANEQISQKLRRSATARQASTIIETQWVAR